MRRFHSLVEFSHFVGRLAERQAGIKPAAAKAASFVLHERAIKIFGDNEKLAPLAQATQDDRVRRGYTPDQPLLRDGTMLRAKVQRFAQGPIAAIGSGEPVQRYHEFGYTNARTGRDVPARPVFRRALEESQPEVERILNMAIAVSLGEQAAITAVLVDDAIL